MPVWQPRAEWLAAAVDSALSQDGCDCELIVVDDGCPEPVAAALAHLRDTRLRILRIPHGGQAEALNAGIETARGEWIRFVDCDDVLEPDGSRRLCQLMDGDRVIAYGATLICDECLSPQRLLSSSLEGDVVAQCLLGQFHVRHPSMLFPRRVVAAAGPWDPVFRISADWDFVLRALEHAPVRGDQRVALYYRRHTRSMTGTADIAAGEADRRRLLQRYFARHPEQLGTQLERRAWAAFHLGTSRAYRRAGYHGEAMRRLARGLVLDPAAGARDAARLAARAAHTLVPRRLRGPG